MTTLADFNTVTFGIAWDDDAHTYVVTVHDFEGDALPADECPTNGHLVATELLRAAERAQV
jgi:hypothetical protein